MKKKVLIAVDDSRHSENMLRHAASLTQSVTQLKFVLYHVQPTISQYLVDEARTKPRANAELETLMQKNHASGRALLEKQKERRVSHGVSATDVQTMSLPRKFGVAKDLLEYGTAMVDDAGIHEGQIRINVINGGFKVGKAILDA